MNHLLEKTKMIKVQKRDGSLTDLDITKIRFVVEWACEGLDVTPVAVESGMKTRLKDGVTTREIQENLIQYALELCSESEPDWRYVAGRLLVWNLRKDITLSRGYGYGNYAIHVHKMIKKGHYTSNLLSYSMAELNEANNWIVPDLDMDYDYAGAKLFSSRYLLPNEMIQEAYLTCALLLAMDQVDVENVFNSINDRLELAHAYYDAFSQRKLSLATPLLANLRRPEGSLTSCFVLSMDDTLESIFRELTNCARISKAGGGIGINVSKIRGCGSTLMKKPNAAKGIVPWIKLINDTAVAVNQGGSRTGAATVSLDIWHIDIPHFLELQTENGDQRTKAYDIFPQVVVTDLFMEKVRDNENWFLFCPYEVERELGIKLPELWGDAFRDAWDELMCAIYDKKLKLYERIPARDLFKLIMQTQIETGLPYITFKDSLNRANPNQHDGYIPGFNLCTESTSNVKASSMAHCCNLVSLNMANIDRDQIGYYCVLSTLLLDTSIDLTNPPFADAKAHNNRYRTIGVGVMGLADYFAKNNLLYASEEARENAYHLFEDIAYHCTATSVEIARNKGAYEAYEGSLWDQGLFMNGRTLEDIISCSKSPERWRVLHYKMKQYGIRNSQLTAIAPNTSSSLVHGCTASVLPVFSRFFVDKAKGAMPIAPPFIKDKYWYYQENKTMYQTEIVKMIATIQKWVDTGISMELLFNLNDGIYWADEPERAMVAKEIYQVMLLAWQLGCKAIYYVRSVQKDSFKEEACVSCAN